MLRNLVIWGPAIAFAVVAFVKVALFFKAHPEADLGFVPQFGIIIGLLFVAFVGMGGAVLNLLEDHFPAFREPCGEE